MHELLNILLDDASDFALPQCRCYVSCDRRNIRFGCADFLTVHFSALHVGSGAPEGIRTPDLCLRRAALYPAELRARFPAS